MGAASLLLCAGLCGCTLPEARAAAPRCSYAALEALPERLTRVANNALAVDVRATRAIFTDERLLADPAELTTALEACTPGDATEPRKREVLAAQSKAASAQLIAQGLAVAAMATLLVGALRIRAA